MENRRVSTYTFTSEKDLKRFFRDALTRDEIEGTMKKVKVEFVNRTGAQPEELRLQRLKKCEVELVRLAREKANVQSPASPEGPRAGNRGIPPLRA